MRDLLVSHNFLSTSKVQRVRRYVAVGKCFDDSAPLKNAERASRWGRGAR
jgi:hypothetical protein